VTKGRLQKFATNQTKTLYKQLIIASIIDFNLSISVSHNQLYSMNDAKTGFAKKILPFKFNLFVHIILSLVLQKKLMFILNV